MIYQGNGLVDYYDDYFFTDGAYSDSVSYKAYENTAFFKTQVGQKTRFSLKAGIRSLVTSYGNEYSFLPDNSKYS